jgi:epoxyqueuosine reductase QueG
VGELKDSVEQELSRTISAYISGKSITGMWREPLIGYASAADPLFQQLKHLAHPGHLLPTDLLKGARSVIAFFLPFEKAVGRSNDGSRQASREWAAAYDRTNELIGLINQDLANLLDKQGFRTATVQATHNFDHQTLVSAWSHRHAAYIAGLGTFGLNRLLITEQGCCGRLGSLVTDLELAPTPRPGYEFCLHRKDGSCNKCIEKCVAHALGLDTFDRESCYRILLENEERLQLPGNADVCGKCSCGLPCSFTNPVKKNKR